LHGSEEKTTTEEGEKKKEKRGQNVKAEAY